MKRPSRPKCGTWSAVRSQPKHRSPAPTPLLLRVALVATRRSRHRMSAVEMSEGSLPDLYITDVECISYRMASLPTMKYKNQEAMQTALHIFFKEEYMNGCTLALHGRTRDAESMTVFINDWKPSIRFLITHGCKVSALQVAACLTNRVYGSQPPKTDPVVFTSIETHHRSDGHHPASQDDPTTPALFEYAVLYYESLSEYKKALRLAIKIADGVEPKIELDGYEINPVQLTIPVEQYLFRRCGIRPNGWAKLPPKSYKVAQEAQKSISKLEYCFEANDECLDAMVAADGPPPPLKLASYDIETQSFKDKDGKYIFPKSDHKSCPIRVIGLTIVSTDPADWKYDSETGKLNVLKQTMYCLTNGGPPKSLLTGGDYKHIRCKSEEELLQTFASLMRDLSPDYLIGYNINKFDNPYLATRIRHLFGGLKRLNSELSKNKKYADVAWAQRRVAWSFGRIPATCSPPIAFGVPEQKSKRKSPGGAADSNPAPKRQESQVIKPPKDALMDSDEEEEDEDAEEEEAEPQDVALQPEPELGFGDLSPETPCRFHSPGIANLDLMEVLLKDAMQSYESYKLENVASKELGEGKLEIDTQDGEDGYTAMFRIFESDVEEAGWEQVRLYCAKDCLLPVRIILKKNLIDFTCEVAYACTTPMNDVLNRGQTCRLLNYYAQMAWRMNYVAVSIPKPERANTFYMSGRYEGAVVLDTKSGYYRTPCACVDFSGLYPSLIRRYRICHSTLIRTEYDAPVPEIYSGYDVHTVELTEPKSEAVPNAFLIKTLVHLLQSETLGIVPAMCEELTNLRKEWKKKLKQATKGSIEYAQASAAEKAVKVLNNSAYGQLGSYRVNPHMGARQLARCVTAMGRWHLLEVGKVVKKHGLIQVAGDTDSIMFNMPNATSVDIIQAKGEEVEAEVNATLKAPMSIEMEKAMWPCVYLRRKMYFYLMWEDGVPIPTLKTMGIPVKRRGMILHFRSAYLKIIDLYMSHPDVISEDEVKRGVLKTMHEMVTTIFDAPLYEFVESQKVPTGTPKNKSKGFLAEEKRAKAVGQPMRKGERIQYVMRYEPPKPKGVKKTNKSELAVEIEQFKEAAKRGEMSIDLFGALEAYQGRFKTLLGQLMSQKEANLRYSTMLSRVQAYLYLLPKIALTDEQLQPAPAAEFKPPPAKDTRAASVIREEWVQNWKTKSMQRKEDAATPIKEKLFYTAMGKQVDVAGSFDPDAKLDFDATDLVAPHHGAKITLDLKEVESCAAKHVDSESMSNIPNDELSQWADSVLKLDSREVQVGDEKELLHHSSHASEHASQFMNLVRETDEYKSISKQLKASVVEKLTEDSRKQVLGEAYVSETKTEETNVSEPTEDQAPVKKPKQSSLGGFVTRTKRASKIGW